MKLFISGDFAENPKTQNSMNNLRWIRMLSSDLYLPCSCMEWVPFTGPRIRHWSWHNSLVLWHLSPLQAPTALLHHPPASPGSLTGSDCLREHDSGTKNEGGPDVITQRQCIPARDRNIHINKKRQMFLIRGVFVLWIISSFPIILHLLCSDACPICLHPLSFYSQPLSSQPLLFLLSLPFLSFLPSPTCTFLYFTGLNKMHVWLTIKTSLSWKAQ